MQLFSFSSHTPRLYKNVVFRVDISRANIDDDDNNNSNDNSNNKSNDTRSSSASVSLLNNNDDSDAYETTARIGGCLRFVCISDTHCMHGSIRVPLGDVLVHTGDFSNFGSLEEVQYINIMPFTYKQCMCVCNFAEVCTLLHSMSDKLQ